MGFSQCHLSHGHQGFHRDRERSAFSERFWQHSQCRLGLSLTGEQARKHPVQLILDDNEEPPLAVLREHVPHRSEVTIYLYLNCVLIGMKFNHRLPRREGTLELSVSKCLHPRRIEIS